MIENPNAQLRITEITDGVQYFQFADSPVAVHHVVSDVLHEYMAMWQI
jgi:hypothetical protein